MVCDQGYHWAHSHPQSQIVWLVRGELLAKIVIPPVRTTSAKRSAAGRTGADPRQHSSRHDRPQRNRSLGRRGHGRAATIGRNTASGSAVSDVHRPTRCNGWLKRFACARRPGGGGAAPLDQRWRPSSRMTPVQYQAGWVHDYLGLEAEAAPFYERAVALGLAEPDLEGLVLSLGSTYRNVGRAGRCRRPPRAGGERLPRQ